MRLSMIEKIWNYPEIKLISFIQIYEQKDKN